MPHVDLSTLSGAELRQLLDTTRARGQAAQSYEILQEMAARREREPGARLKPRRRTRGEPRIIAVDLGDPLERREEPEAPVAAAGEFDFGPFEREPAATDMPAEPLDFRLERPAPPPQPPASRRRAPWAMGAFVAGAALGVAAGWWAADAGFGPPAAPPEPSPAEFAAAAAPPEAAAAPPPQTLDVAVVEPAPLPEPVAPPIDAVAAAADASDQAVHSPDTGDAPETPPAEGAPAATACAGAVTPADRTICGDPELQRLQKALRQAYAEALDAHAERGLLRQRQLAWRDSRNSVTDPDRLAALYEARIRKLNAATADAHRRNRTDTPASPGR